MRVVCLRWTQALPTAATGLVYLPFPMSQPVLTAVTGLVTLTLTLTPNPYPIPNYEALPTVAIGRIDATLHPAIW